MSDKLDIPGYENVVVHKSDIDMTNEEKARKLDEKFREAMFSPKEYHFTDCLLEMAHWKDEQFAKEKQQWIDKTTKWLEEQDFGGWIESETEDLVNDFKQFAKDEV